MECPVEAELGLVCHNGLHHGKTNFGGVEHGRMAAMMISVEGKILMTRLVVMPIGIIVYVQVVIHEKLPHRIIAAGFVLLVMCK